MSNITTETTNCLEHLQAVDERISQAGNVLSDLSGRVSELRSDLTESPEKIVRQITEIEAEKTVISIELTLLQNRRQALLKKLEQLARQGTEELQLQMRRHKESSRDRATELMSSDFGDGLRQHLLALAHLQGLGVETVCNDLFKHRPQGHQEEQHATKSLGEYVEPPVASDALRAAQQVISDNKYSGVEMPDLEVA